MSLPATPGCAKVALQYTNYLEGNKCENVFYIKEITGAINADPVPFCNAVFAAAVAHLSTQLSQYVILNGVGYEDVSVVPFGGVSVPQEPTPGLGTTLGAQLPASASLAIKKTTATLGRAGRGRWYWPIGSAGFLLNGNTVIAANASAWAASLTAFQAQVEAYAPGPSMGIVSYFSGGVMRTAGLFSRITSWGASDLNVDSQRRRLAGRGA